MSRQSPVPCSARRPQPAVDQRPYAFAGVRMALKLGAVGGGHGLDQGFVRLEWGSLDHRASIDPALSFWLAGRNRQVVLRRGGTTTLRVLTSMGWPPGSGSPWRLPSPQKRPVGRGFRSVAHWGDVRQAGHGHAGRGAWAGPPRRSAGQGRGGRPRASRVAYPLARVRQPTGTRAGSLW
jgi:hypothetical protein